MSGMRKAITSWQAMTKGGRGGSPGPRNTAATKKMGRKRKKFLGRALTAQARELHRAPKKTPDWAA